MSYSATLVRRFVSQFQAVQHRDCSVTLRVARGPDWNAEGFDRIVERLQGYLRGLPLKIEFINDRILPMPNGKTKTIVIER